MSKQNHKKIQIITMIIVIPIAISLTGMTTYKMLNSKKDAGKTKSYTSTIAILSPTTAPTPTLSPTPTIITTITPLLSDVNFPKNEIDYPEKWPEILIYPPELQLVEASLDNTNPEKPSNWEAKLLYKGNFTQAAKRLTLFFEKINWEIIDNTNTGTESILMLIEGENGETGIITIAADAQNKNLTKIHSSVFL